MRHGRLYLYSPAINEFAAAPAPWPGLPSDQSDEVLAFGRTDIVAMAVSLSARAADGQDEAYLRWHALDHMPEQYRIGGVRHGARWVSTPQCRAARLASDDRYDAVDHVTTYLFAEPLAESLDAFFELGRTLREAGRLPTMLPAVELGGYRLAARGARDDVRLGADVLPWRPHRGLLLLIESCREPVVADVTDLLAINGVSGAWSYRGEADLFRGRFADTAGLVMTMCYLDDDPPHVAVAAHGVLTKRWATRDVTPLLAAPFEAVRPFALGAALPTSDGVDRP